MNTSANENKEIAKSLEQLKEALEAILREYENTEKSIAKTDIDKKEIGDPAKTDTAAEAVGDFLKKGDDVASGASKLLKNLR